jgi:hypothetical protein
VAEGVAYRKGTAPDLSRPRPHGLASVATNETDTLANVLQGLSYEADCGAEVEVDLGACGPLAIEEATERLTTFQRDPITFTVKDICAIGYTREQQLARARMKLARVEAAAAACALGGADLVQGFAAQAGVPVLATAPVSVACALGLADEFGADRALPTVAYVASRFSASFPADALTDVAGVLTTRGGTTVALVPCIGETAPAGSTVEADWWMWITGPLRIIRAEPEPTWDEYPTLNKRVAQLSRSMIIDWTCAVAAIPLTDPCEGAAANG